MAESPKKRGRRFFLFAIAALAIGLTACFARLIVIADRPRNGIRVERLEADLNGRLPDGSTLEVAEAWFASHSIQPVIATDNDGRTVVYGAVPNDSVLDHAEIRIHLEFRRDGRLRARDISRFIYSL